jgi:inner membrane protein
MPSPIAHSISGYAIARLFPLAQKSSQWSESRTLPLFYGVFVATAADLDFIPQILTGKRYHHGLTHSLTFAIGFTVIAWILGYWLRKRWSTQLFLLTLMLYGSHLLLDFFTQGGDGIQLLWPFSTEYFRSSVSLFPSTYWSKPFLQDSGHLTFIIFELAYAGILMGGVGFLKDKQKSKKQRTDRCTREF